MIQLSSTGPRAVTLHKGHTPERSYAAQVTPPSEVRSSRRRGLAGFQVCRGPGGALAVISVNSSVEIPASSTSRVSSAAAVMLSRRVSTVR